MPSRFRLLPRWRAIGVRLHFAVLATVAMQIAATPLEDYEKCTTSGFGKTSLICDSEGSLKNTTRDKLEAVLESLKANAKRPERCATAANRRDYIGLLQVTSSKSIDESGDDLKTNAKQIYDRSGLGNTECDNGVLIFFIRDKQQLATYNGNNNFVQLTKTDLDKLHKLAGKGDDDEGALALQFLKDGRADDDVQRAETWAPVVGITAALVLVLLILALCLAFFIARICCCAGRAKKHKYYVTPEPSYKQHEPVYIVTPPPSEHHGVHSDIIYSTPYTGTPLPAPSLYTMPPTGFYAPSAAPHHTAASNTPNSSKGVRIRDQGGALKSADHTPRLTHKLDKINRSGTATSKHSHATYQTVNASSTTTIPLEDSPPHSQPSFLDPMRQLETQTKEDFIA